MLPRFLNSRFGLALVKQLHAREIAGEKVSGRSFLTHHIIFAINKTTACYHAVHTFYIDMVACVTIWRANLMLLSSFFRQPPINTVAVGKDQNSSQFWLEMFKTMSETVSVGMVVTDMNLPGCPLAYINEGFKTVTGENRLVPHCLVRLLHLDPIRRNAVCLHPCLPVQKRCTRLGIFLYRK